MKKRNKEKYLYVFVLTISHRISELAAPKLEKMRGKIV